MVAKCVIRVWLLYVAPDSRCGRLKYSRYVVFLGFKVLNPGQYCYGLERVG